MNQTQLTKVIEDTLASTSALLISKGAEYASDNDRLDNFKKNATLLGLSPLQVWSVYAFKHVDAIQSYMRRVQEKQQHASTIYLPSGKTFEQWGGVGRCCEIVDEQLSEPIEGRFHDAINYLFLGLAILHEIKNLPEVKPADSTIDNADIQLS